MTSSTPQLKDLREIRSRRSLAKMLAKLFDLWGLTDEERCLLLGLTTHEMSVAEAYRHGEPLADEPDILLRAGHLLAIHKALRILFPRNRDLVYSWVSRPNRRFEEQRPLDIMVRDFDGMVDVRNYLDAELLR